MARAGAEPVNRPAPLSYLLVESPQTGSDDQKSFGPLDSRAGGLFCAGARVSPWLLPSSGRFALRPSPWCWRQGRLPASPPPWPLRVVVQLIRCVFFVGTAFSIGHHPGFECEDFCGDRLGFFRGLRVRLSSPQLIRVPSASRPCGYGRATATPKLCSPVPLEAIALERKEQPVGIVHDFASDCKYNRLGSRKPQDRREN